MTPSDLLQSINLGEYLPVFSENALDEGSLRTLTDEDLKKLGVAKLGHRKKILDAIAKMPASGSLASPLSGFVETFPNVVALPLREYLREEHRRAPLDDVRYNRVAFEALYGGVGG